MSKFQDFLRIRRSRSVPITIPARAKFFVDRDLVSKQLREAARLAREGVVVKALR